MDFFSNFQRFFMITYCFLEISLFFVNASNIIVGVCYFDMIFTKVGTNHQIFIRAFIYPG